MHESQDGNGDSTRAASALPLEETAQEFRETVEEGLEDLGADKNEDEQLLPQFGAQLNAVAECQAPPTQRLLRSANTPRITVFSTRRNKASSSSSRIPGRDDSDSELSDSSNPASKLGRRFKKEEQKKEAAKAEAGAQSRAQRSNARTTRDWSGLTSEDYVVTVSESGEPLSRTSNTELKWEDILTLIAIGPPNGQTVRSLAKERTGLYVASGRGRGRGKGKPRGRVRGRGKASAMRFVPGQSNGHSNQVVQEWEPQDAWVVDYGGFKSMSGDAKEALIQREAEENGIVKPKGYTVSFHYNPEVEYHHFGSSHPMKPWRLTLTKQLILAYGLEYAMDLHQPRSASFDELAIFHDREYLGFLQYITPQNLDPAKAAYLEKFGFGGESNDCPVFDGLWNYVSLYSGASLNAANNLLNGQSDIAINWSGGLHHAKKNAASGFCYVNDIVLAIQHLLTQNQRVLYIDVDVHHGDGVEQAFESTDRVFTLSYHKFGLDRYATTFFPGTGNINEVGPTDPSNRGKGHTLNIPLDDGIDDEQYKWLFKTVTGAVILKYQPNTIVLQCGADSLGGDRLGRFNLNIKAHGYCVEFVKSFNLPLLLIGGGGYTPRNVARTWCHETAVCTGSELHNNLPTHLPYLQAFDGTENGNSELYPNLHNTKRHDNQNTREKLQKLVAQALENLQYLEGAPSVVMNHHGLTEAQIMHVREKVEQELKDEAEDKGNRESELGRRRRERNTGGRGEHRFR